ncbi:MAG: MmgE/PrpD family protein [Actinomycetota bacterium]|nr:MmgE/PrpD family protein [Actinomycetota bacterium]
MTRPVIEFVHDLALDDLPTAVVGRMRACLVDLLGVAAAGHRTRLSAVARGHAVQYMRGADRTARLLFDGRAVSPLGAAFANAATIDAMDGHDGHRLTKGHAGVAVLPAALSLVTENPATALGDLLTALVVGYEIAFRAGAVLHRSTSDYHSSGSWNAIGAAAVAARLLALNPAETAHALGIAEYQAPRAPMMRCIDHPSMVKDSSAWGAEAGVSGALLAAGGFTGAPSALVTDMADDWDDLGDRWMVLEQYFKPYPVCRWSHPAIHATLGLVRRYDVAPREIQDIRVTTFHAATRLGTRSPADTEQAQYSLPFTVACAAVHRRLEVDDVAHPERMGAEARRLAMTLQMHESAEMTSAFPASRVAEVTLTLTDGRRLESGPTQAPGDPEAALSPAELEHKFLAWAGGGIGRPRAHRVLSLIQGESGLSELLAEIYPPVDAAEAPSQRPC